ncbi:MAG: M20/M25/M40 family metallo-hydrolase [Pseudonocardiaceae bacterium]|jgi:acetylornithine deacetylase/succinyl-diaminopimelate desuccinylase-like protein|nr:M20/M25/M40 family metallo-hydrolase [Pseudonocardiaceae bacterium]
MERPVGGTSTAEDEVVGLASDLIRINSTNTGDPDTLVGERAAAEYVAEKLSEVGFETTYLESGAPGRGNVIARLAGADPTRGALLIHGHLDVVPADASEWSVHPFSGAVQDGYLWGRGAIDMKDMVAMTIAVARRFRRDGVIPPRDLVFAFVADEEAGGLQGAHWLVEHRRNLFEGCTEAISEVGGFSLTVREGRRLYLIQTAEKGINWMRLRAQARPGHGAVVHEDNAVTALCAAVTRLGNHRFPLVMTDSVQEFLTAVGEETGLDFSGDNVEGAVAKLGALARLIGATLRDTANPTMLDAGYKANVIPSTAEAVVDCRVLPGRQAAFEREVDELLGPGITREWVLRLPPVETTFDGDLVGAMDAAIRHEDPGARTVPYMLFGGTDAKAFSRLGMRCFGFAPLRLPPDLDFAALFHGIDERVPIDGLTFGTRVLDRFLRSC